MARRCRKSGHDLLGAGHLGDQFRVDEADGLDPFRPGGFEAQDQFGAGRGVEDRLLVLQAVAGTDLDDLDRAGAHRRGSGAELCGVGASGGA